MGRGWRGFVLSAVCCLSLCEARAQSSAWRDSLATLNRQIALSPRSTDLRLKKAAVNIELDQWDYAIEEYGRVLDIDAKNLAALYFRAYAYSHQRQPQLALHDYEAFLSQVPTHFEARLGLAMMKRQLGRTQDALDQLNLLVQQHPDSANAYAARADYETELAHYDAALYDWDEALHRQPCNLQFIGAKYELLTRLHRSSEAWQVLEEAMRQGVPRAALRQWTGQRKKD